MKTINTYIIEKLNIDKNIKTPKYEYNAFFVIYSDIGKTKVRNFSDYDEAMAFAKEKYYLSGYAYSFEWHDGEIFQKVNKFILDKKTKELIDYLNELEESNKIIKIFRYKKNG